MISVAADTDAAAAVPLPRCKAIPHTDQATANAPFFLFILLPICLFTSLSLSPFFFFFFTGNPARCRDNFTEPSRDTRLPTTHIRQSRSQWGSASHVPFDTSHPKRHDNPLAHHSCLSKHRRPTHVKAEILASCSSSLQLLTDLPTCCETSRYQTASWTLREPRLTCSCQLRPWCDSTQQAIDLCVMSPP